MVASAAPVSDLLQAGIYLQPSSPPPPAWRVLLLDFSPPAAPSAAAEALEQIMQMLAVLQAGEMRELAATRRGEQSASIPADSFDFQLGFGASFFEPPGTPLTEQERPAHLVRLRQDGPAFPSLPWAGPPSAAGEADLALQFFGVSEHAVDRAAVEVCKLIDDGQLPLVPAHSFDGFQRDDGRSWIGFHDGISNIEPSQRLAAVQCLGDPDWNRGGTFMALLRIELALGNWRSLSRESQEAIVGRDKLSGCPLQAAPIKDGQPSPEVVAGCPIGDSSTWQERDAFFNPPESGDCLVEASHVHRVNQNRGAGGTRAGHRVFRQGFEYLDSIGPEGPRLGLNFVSFQNDLEQLQQILGLEGWLGDVNFGGPANPAEGEPQPPSLMSLVAGGFYVVPPVADPFPGARLF